MRCLKRVISENRKFTKKNVRNRDVHTDIDFLYFCVVV